MRRSPRGLDHAVNAARSVTRGCRRRLTEVSVSCSLRLVLTNRVDGLTALGDPTRRAIFERLAARPRPVGELAQGLPVSRPAVSQHLKVLKDAGLVIDHQIGTRRIYQLDPDGVGALRAYLDQHWNRALAAFKTAAEHRNEETS
jgi:DNA-binding transcriptional ArsR family regulator